MDMDLGAFSVSLAAEDLARSRDFYGSLGYEIVGGDGEQWLVLRNGTTTIGLFQGMFDRNVLTFNPGWDAKARPLEGDFTDVRTLQRRVREAGHELLQACDEDGEGPASFVVVDPDGNPVLVDQHV